MPTSIPQTAEQLQPPPLLAIDTSSAQAGVALYDGDSLSIRSWPAGRSHTTTLLAEIHHVLEVASVEVSGLVAVAVAIGPGTFTGLRVGFGVAKGFHLAQGVPLIGVSTLEATALPFATHGAPIVATVGAGRGRLVWARYEPSPDGVVEIQPPRNGTADELAAELAGDAPTIVAGELDEEQLALVTTTAGVTAPPLPFRIRQPGAIAEIGWRRWTAGLVDDAANLEPLYLSR
jgi:tRNA threonylcarbamoyladenosine biosynthesis protein TsaB